MGRYYSGQISGKFWFSIQASDDASYFGRSYDEDFIYYVCNCTIDTDDSEKALFCANCYDSYEQHREAMAENDISDEKTWRLSDFEIKYNFDECDIDTVKSKIQELEVEVGQYMDSYKITDEDDNIEYSYVAPSNVSDYKLELLARLCLGKQILYCLEKNGTCSFSADT